MLFSFFSLLLVVSLSDDPANGWLGYATGVNPSGGDDIITFIEAYWNVPENPKVDGAFFSPWFGIESSDNKNLIQPVNPWASNHWEIYNEYFQWSPEHNENSRSHDVNAGDLIYGSVTYNKSDNSYFMHHCDLDIDWCVDTTIAIQDDKEGNPKPYTITYFVMEKTARCDQYPPNNSVTFFNISVEYNYQKVAPKWTTDYVDNVCDCRAHVVDEATIQITWDSGSNEFDYLVQKFEPGRDKTPPL